MSGKPGQQTTKPTDVDRRYAEGFMEELDYRYRAAKTLRQRLLELTGDLGGADLLSYQELSLAKRAIHVERVIEKFESRLAHGAEIEYAHLFGLVNCLSGLYSKLGLKRRPRHVQSLDEYIKTKYSRHEITHQDGAQSETPPPNGAA